MAQKPKRQGHSPVRGRRIGERSEAVRERLSQKLGLPGSAIDRAALDQLAQNDDFRERLRAFRAASELLDRWRGEFGGPVLRPRLHLRAGKPLSIYTREGEHVIPKTLVQASKLSDGRFRLDLQVVQGEEFLVLEALRLAAVPEAIVPLSAVHLAPVIAPAAGEVALNGPSGVERVVWGDDGVRRTYLGDELLPNRTARYVST
jgi:hypothetical protein